MEKFNIFEYVGSNLDEQEKFLNLYNIELDVDNNSEPFINIYYKTNEGKNDLFVGLKSGLLALKDIENVLENFVDDFSIHKKPVITILYNSKTNKLVVEYGLAVGELANVYKNLYVLGYVIDPKANLTFQNKVECLYDIMAKAINKKGYISVCGAYLKNPYYKKDAFGQIVKRSDNESEEINQENMTLIEKFLKEKIGPQKTIK